MDTEKEKADEDQTAELQEGEAIERAFVQMETIYKSRCVQAPFGGNVIVREIKNQE